MPHKDRSAYDRARYRATREAWLARNAAYREANRDSVRAKSRRHRAENLDAYRAYDRAYYLANREAILARKAIAHRVNREVDNASQRTRYHLSKKQITDRQWRALKENKKTRK